MVEGFCLARRESAFCLALAISFSCAPSAFALGTEGFGNEPIASFSNSETAAVVNLKSRVYWREVNGDYRFFYRGATDAVNEALQTFAKIEADGKEVVLLAGPGETGSFHGKKVPFNWNVHVPGAIYLHMANREQGTRVFTKNPTLTVYVDGKTVSPDRLAIPDGIRVLDAGDLLERYRGGLESSDIHVRAHAALQMAETGPCADFKLEELTRLLDRNEHEYVRRCAAGALANLGPRAEAALPALRAGLDDDNISVQRAFQKSIADIQASKAAEKEAGSSDYADLCAQIHKLKRPRPNGAAHP